MMIETLALRQARAVAVLVQRSAVEATKRELRAKGLKPQHMPMREIVVLAEEYLAAHRAVPVAEAKVVVEEWTAEGFFGKRAARSVRKDPELRTLDDREQREMPWKWSMTEAAPIAPNRTLRRLPNAAYRQREYLTEAEVERLIEAARKRGRNGPRDAAAILLAYRHGLRAAELCQLRWAQIDLRQGRLHVNRAKGGCGSVHPLHGPELRALRPLQGAGPYVFVTEAGTPTTTAWFLRMVQRTGQAAKLPFPVHPHMLRHSTGYKLANDGHDTRSLAHYLGHRNLQSTARYTALAEGRFKGFWRD